MCAARVRVGVRAYGVEAAAAPPPRPVGGARRGAGRGGVRSGGVAPPRRRVPLLPVAAAKRRRWRWRLPCLPAPEPAVPGTYASYDSGGDGGPRFINGQTRLVVDFVILPCLTRGSCSSLPTFCFSEQLNKPAEVRRNVIGAVDFAVPVSAEFRVRFVPFFPRSGELSGHFAEFRDGWFAERREQAWGGALGVEGGGQLLRLQQRHQAIRRYAFLATYGDFFLCTLTFRAGGRVD